MTISHAIAHSNDQSTVLERRRRAIIYCRVSTDKQEQDGESLDFQEEKCRQYAALHNLSVVLVAKETKSGFIHYNLREKLTLARQWMKDKLADVIIVWDLRRFSRNFVHSAMIFEEIESAGGEIISVSENIDNSLTGKLIRSILAWGAENERHTIVGYANRRWQARWEANLPVGVGRPLYGWAWGDKQKSTYVLDEERAAIRFSILHMYVELNMSLRAIVNKLSEDCIPTPGWEEREHEEGERPIWNVTTIRRFIADKANIGTLTICRYKEILTPDGKRIKEVHPSRKEVPGKLPPICDIELYERALLKLASNQKALSHLPSEAEEYLLRGHVYCAVCGRAMAPRTNIGQRGTVTTIYKCPRSMNKFRFCPGPTIRTEPLGEIVWEEVSLLIERIDALQQIIEEEMKQALGTILEDTTGHDQLGRLRSEIAYAEQQLALHEQGSYMYNLIAADLLTKKEQFARFEEELGAVDIESVTATYRKRILRFLEFLNTMRGNYQEATFEQKRNTLEVLGVRVQVNVPETLGEEDETEEERQEWLTGPEWYTGRQAAQRLGVVHRTIYRYINDGTLKARRVEEPFPTYYIHRDELRRLRLSAKELNTAKMVRKRIEISFHPLIFLPTGVSLPSQRKTPVQPSITFSLDHDPASDKDLSVNIHAFTLY